MLHVGDSTCKYGLMDDADTGSVYTAHCIEMGPTVDRVESSCDVVGGRWFHDPDMHKLISTS
jgi:hypothetical protein